MLSGGIEGKGVRYMRGTEKTVRPRASPKTFRSPHTTPHAHQRVRPPETSQCDYKEQYITMHVRRVSHSWLGIRCKNSSRQQGPVKGPGGGEKPGRRPFLLYSSDTPYEGSGGDWNVRNVSLPSHRPIRTQGNAAIRDRCPNASRCSVKLQTPVPVFVWGGKGHSHTTLNRLQAALSRSCNQTLTHMHLGYSRVGGRVPVLCLLGGTHPYLLLRR